MNDEVDVLLKVNINENASSRKSSNEYFVSFDIMSDHIDLWEVTIVPSALSEVASSNDATAPSVTILNIINERDENKRDLYLSSDGNRSESKWTCGGKHIWGTKRSKIISMSPVHERSNRDNSRCSFSSDKRMSVLRADDNELDDRTDGRISKEENTRQLRVYKDMGNESRALFIELGAICKILDFVTDSDPRVSSLASNCCDEIARALRCLVAQRRDKKLEDLLLNDSSLYRCDCCGVISYVLESRSVTEEIKGNGSRGARDVRITTAERDYANGVWNDTEIEISGSPADLKGDARSQMFVNSPEVDRRAKYKDELNGPKSLPVKERAFVTISGNGRSNDAGNISDTEANSKIKNTSRLDNSAVQKLFTNFEMPKRREKYEFDCITQNRRSRKDDTTTAMKIHANIDQEEIVRKVSYDSKSRIDDLPSAGIERHPESARKTRCLRRPFEKNDDIYEVTNTMKYLSRGGQSMTLDKEENYLLSKLRERCGIHAEDARRKRSFVLYDSRDDCPQCDSGFWLFDKSGNLPEIPLDESRYRALSRPDNNSDNFHGNISRCFNAEKNTAEETIGRIECMEKDSLDSYTKLERGRESDTTTFVSSSSAENLMHEWMGSPDERNGINDVDKDIGRGRKLVSSRPSLDIARHVRAEIEENRRADNVKKSMREPPTRDSNIFAGLSPETRRRICHLIQRIVSSDSAKEMVFHDEKRLATDALSSKKLLHSKSVDATLVRCGKLGEITNTLVDDCIPTKLSELPEDKNRSLEKRDNVADTRSQDLDISKNCATASREYSASVSFHEFEKMRFAGGSSEKIVRRIVYKDISSRDIADNNAVTEILSAYRKILENSENMDWNNFRQLIEHLHPRQKGLWHDVCRTIRKVAGRVASDANDGTEVCIEISPVAHEEILKTGKVMACTREIVFELDMTLEGVDDFFSEKP